MQELIKVTKNENGNSVVSAINLHQFLQNTDNVSTWFKRQVERAMLQENEDYVRVAILQPSGQTSYDYAITLSSAKEIAMLNGGDKGKQARLYFIECEKMAKNNVGIPKTYAQALLEAGRLALQLEQTQAKLIEAQPKLDFYEAVTESKDAVDMGTVAKVLNLGFGRTTLFQKLRDAKILMKNNQPYQNFCDLGYFRIVESTWIDKNGDQHINFKTLVFQKGIDYILKVLKKTI